MGQDRDTEAVTVGVILSGSYNKQTYTGDSMRLVSYITTGGPDGIEAQSLGPIVLQCCDTVGWVI